MATNSPTFAVDQRLDELFTIAANMAPAWLNEHEIVFLSDRTGTPQVFSVDITTRGQRQITTGDERVLSLIAEGNGQIVFGEDVEGNERQQISFLAAGSSRAKRLTNQPESIHEPGAISRDGALVAYRTNARDQARFDVMVIDPTSGKPRPRLVLEGDGQPMPIAFSKDNSKLLVRRTNTNLDCDLLLVDVESGESQLLTPHRGEAWMPHAELAPDDASVWVLTNLGRNWIGIDRISIASGERVTIVQQQWDIEQLAISPNGRTMAFAVNVDGYSRLFLAPITGQHPRPVSRVSHGVIDRMAWSPDGTRLVVGMTTPTTTSALFLVDQDGAVTELVAGTKASFDLATPATIRFATFDSHKIPALWFTPPTSSPWPVIVDVHGGPESQRRPGFTPLTQFFVSLGYAVLSTNVRGSTGYGKDYSHLDDIEKRLDSVADLDAAVTWLKARHDVDPARIVVMGQSYGGFMTLAALTEYPDHWAAGVEVVGIANFVTFLERTGPWRRKHRAAEYGDPDRHRAVLERISPIHKVDRIKAPLMVIHGRNDPRVPLYETEQMVEAINARGGVVEMRVFDNEGHGLSKRANKITGYGAVARFLRDVLD